MRRIALPATLLALLASALTWGVWHASQRYLAQGISKRAERSGPDSAPLLHQATRLGDVAVGPLMRLAASPQLEVAEPARRELDALAEAWRLEGVAGVSGRLDARVAVTTRELQRVAPTLTPSGQRWARSLAVRLLRLVDLADASHAPGMLADCDRAMASLSTQATAQDLTVDARSAPAAEAPTIPTGVAPAASLALDLAPPDPTAFAPGAPASAAAGAAAQEAAQPAEPAPVAQSATPTPLEPPQQLTPREQERGLLRAYLELDKNDIKQGLRLRSALAQRGLARLSRPQIVGMLAEDALAREALAHGLLADSQGDPVSALLWLARDPASRVRVAAVSALGSSPDRGLKEEAWRLALNDTDPRVARLAAEIEKLLR